MRPDRAPVSASRLSPGLDIDYRGGRDQDALLQKLAPLLDAGVEWFVLALDDIPNRPGLALEQVDLSAWLLDSLRSRRADIRLTLVPTEYVGTRPTSYLEDLAAGLPAEIDVMWTGPTVCSPVVRAADARAWATALAGRRPLLWDNYPVNDGTMERSIHLGPYRGREPELTDELDGVLCNPMLQPHVVPGRAGYGGRLPGRTGEYDPDASWSRAIAAVGKSRAASLQAMAAACADGPLLPPEHLEADALVTALADATSVRPGPTPFVHSAITHGRPRRRARMGRRGDDPLAAELEPWLASAAVEADAGLAVLRLIQHTYPSRRSTATEGRPCSRTRSRQWCTCSRRSSRGARRAGVSTSYSGRGSPLSRCRPARRRPAWTRRRSRGRRGPVCDRPVVPCRAVGTRCGRNGQRRRFVSVSAACPSPSR